LYTGMRTETSISAFLRGVTGVYNSGYFSRP
jgi:hypothetical protein